VIANMSVTAYFLKTSSGIAPATGDGATTATAYQIKTLGNLAWLHNQAAVSSTGSKYYKLMNDIDATETACWDDDGTTTATLEGFNPIGGTNSSYAFKGVFLGQGHKITGLVINRSSTIYVGLFGYIESIGRVSNLGLVGGSVTGSSYVGGLTGYNYGTVSNCYATGAVSGSDENVGGLVGCNDKSVSDCYATGAVLGSGGRVGGLVGYNSWGTVSNCYTTGAVTGSSSDVGGLVGFNSSGTISNCYAIGAVTGTGWVGGLVGYNYSDDEEPSKPASVTDSYWDTQTTGQASSAGGGTGKTTADMKQQATFSGWDFTSVWDILDSYPCLRGFNTLTLTYTAGPGGTIDGATSQTQTVNYGASGTAVTAIPDAGYQFASWSDGATSATRTDAGLTTDTTMTAAFEAIVIVPPTAPTVASAAALTNNAKPTWTWTPGGGGNGTFRYQLDATGGGGWTTTTATSWTPSSALSDGTHTLYVQERDAAGNWSEAGSYTVTVDATAPTAPTVISAASLTNDATPTWTWTAGGGGNGTFRYQLDATGDGGWAITTATSWMPSSALSDGTYTLYVQERDAADNWSEAGSYTVTVDATAPGAPVVISSSNVTNNRRATWTWTSGGGGNGTFRYQLDATSDGGWTTTTATSYQPPADLSYDNHVLHVQERDDAGNWSASGSCTVLVTKNAAQDWQGYR
jgi:hypothetical protein